MYMLCSSNMCEWVKSICIWWMLFRTHAHTQTHTHTLACMHVCTHTLTHISSHMSACTHAYTHIYTRMHTHTHKYKHHFGWKKKYIVRWACESDDVKKCEWVSECTLWWKDACYLNKRPTIMCLSKKKKKKGCLCIDWFVKMFIPLAPGKIRWIYWIIFDSNKW